MQISKWLGWAFRFSLRASARARPQFKAGNWLCALFIVGCAGDIGMGQQYQVEGTVSGTAFELNGKPRTEPMESRLFILCVSNGTWEMILKLTDKSAAYYRKQASQTGRPFDMPDYERLTFDGTDLYCFEDSETGIGKFSAKMRAAGTPIPAENDNRAEAAVVGQEVPHFVEGDSQIWLTYATGGYFKNLNTNVLEASWRWGFDEVQGMLLPGDSVKRRATWELQPDAPQLPKSVTYYLGDIGNITNAQYTVNSYRTFQNLTLPLESTLDVYRADPRFKGATNMIHSIHYIVRATAFKPLEKGFTFPPEVPVLTAVTDHRFNGTTDPAPNVPVPYTVRGQFLTREEARETASYAEFKLGIKNPIRVNPAVARRNRELEAASDKLLAEINSMPARNRHRRIMWSVAGVIAVSSAIALFIAVRKLKSKRVG